MKSSAQNVSIYAGFSPTWASPTASTTVTVDGYDIQGNVVKTATATVPSGQDAHAASRFVELAQHRRLRCDLLL